MAKMWDEKINANTNWAGDESTGGLPVKGSRVQEFIREQLASLGSGLGSKFGAAKYEGGNIKFYDEDGGKELASITLSGTSYIIRLESDKTSNFNVLTSDTEATITFTPSTTAIEMGQSQGTPFPEDYKFTLEVDSGSGYIEHTPVNNSIRSGDSGVVDIRAYLKTGANRIRIIVSGESSEQTKTTVWTANLTTLTLSCNHRWERAWIEGEDYSIDNIYFGGNIAKKLHVKIDDVEYTKDFSAAQQYTNVAYEFDCKNYFPEDGSGIYAVEVWMTSDGVETAHTKFNIMCVAEDEVTTAKLTVVNNIPDKVVNYASNTLFNYATYNRTSVTLTIEADLNGSTIVIVDEESLSCLTQTKISYITNVTIETEEVDNLVMSITLDEQEFDIDIDNSNAYLPTQGAYFYMQPSLRNNNTEDKEDIRNTASGATKTTYDAEWTNMTWSNSDGWTLDEYGNKVLSLRAGSTLSVEDLTPLATSSAAASTFEFMYSVKTCADYDNPILTIIDSDTFDESSSRGIVLFPTRLLILTSNERASVYQRIDLREDSITHIAVTLRRNFAGTGRNLCSIFVNGAENVSFEYSGTSNFGNGYLRVGQNSTDINLYMIRCYNKALDSNDVFNNFLNAAIDTTSKPIIRADNDIIDGGVISYDLVKKAGMNCLVYETDEALPSLAHPETSTMRVNVRLEYADTPEWNVIVKNVPIDGQGTTSSRYYRWNLRNKIKASDTEWEYPNYEGGTTETGKEGYLAGYGLHPKVSTITSKKNIASSPQGHKMGATGLYNDLFMICEGNNMLPSNARVATYQYPMMTFQMYSDGHYEYRGLMTIGPDKKDKKTFGYNATSAYPSLMMLEGPNHAPRMTRFLVPWTSEVFYDYANETLSYGGEEGWDADIAAGYSTDKSSDADSITTLYETEFKPAYDAIYYTSPYIASLTEVGKTLEQINADIPAFQSGTTNEWSNELLTLYNSNYELIYYSNAQGKYVILPLSVHNLKTYLNLTGSPTTSEIVQARSTKFKSEVFNYVSKSEALYHYVFCELLAVTDNFAKNSYWRKFESIANGGKWGFNQDDLDTIFETDNNGQDTKSYSVEVQDVNDSDGSEIFQGQSSAFWTAIRLWCADDIADKYKDVIDGLVELAGTHSVAGSTTHQSVINAISYYFHSNSAKYFPATAYNYDTEFSYSSVWAIDPDAVYNNVPPLTQIHGDHYETEMAWIERRVDYMMSKYALGGWTGSGDDGLGKLEFTPAQVYNLQVKPALDNYPRMSIGGSQSSSSSRTKAGETYTMTLPASSNTTVYVKGVDLLEDIGDLSSLVIASRGGSEEIPFSIVGKRLRNVKCGSDTASNVSFNATNMKISGDAIEKINLKNCTSVKGNLDLTNCNRVREIDLTNTNLTTVLPPVGGHVSKLYLPTNQSTLFLHTLNLLKSENLNLPQLDKIESLYIQGMSSLDALQMLFSILGEENVLKYVTLVWDGEAVVTDVNQFNLLKAFADSPYNPTTGEGYGRLVWENGRLNTMPSSPNMQGVIRCNANLYRSWKEDVENAFPNVTINAPTDYYQDFVDPEVKRIISTTLGNGIGILESVWCSKSDVFPSSLFKGNTTIEYFNELGLTKYTVFNTQSNEFNNCTNLKEVSLPQNSDVNNRLNSTFRNCTSLKKVTMDKPLTILGMSGTFFNCSSLTDLPDSFETPRLVECIQVFYGCSSLKVGPAFSQTSTSNDFYGLFEGCTSLETINGTYDTSISINTQSMFRGCNNLKKVNQVIFNAPLSKNSRSMFRFCYELTGDIDLRIPNSSYGDLIFQHCKKLNKAKLTIGSKCTTMESSFDGCLSLEEAEVVGTPSCSCAALFRNCVSLKSQPLIDCSKITRANEMFRYCTFDTLDINVPNAITAGYIVRDSEIKHIKNLIAPLATTFIDIAANSKSLEDVQNIDCSSATTIKGMFSGCSSLTSCCDIDAPVATNAACVFQNCTSLVTAPSIIAPKATNVSSLFQNCVSLETIPFCDFGSATTWDYITSGTYKLTNFGGFKGWKPSLDLYYSTTLTKESGINAVTYMYGGTSDSKQILYVNPTVKAIWQADTEYWSQLTSLMNSKNIVLYTAS